MLKISEVPNSYPKQFTLKAGNVAIVTTSDLGRLFEDIAISLGAEELLPEATQYLSERF